MIKYLSGYENDYWVSSEGRVFSRVARGNTNTKSKTVVLTESGIVDPEPGSLPAAVSEIGATTKGVYRRIALKTVEGWEPRYVHQLVAEVFHGPCPEGQEIMHINHDKLDCRAANLKYGTHAQNVKDSIPDRGPTNSRNAKLKPSEVLRMRQLYDSDQMTQVELADFFECSVPNVGKIVRRESWKWLE